MVKRSEFVTRRSERKRIWTFIFYFSYRWMAATQFQTTFARRAFPCFDEPKFKATFKVSIDRPITYEPALTNTMLEESYPITFVQTIFLI
jgi:aminopeptidase N